jgi:hypothetical protein
MNVKGSKIEKNVEFEIEFNDIIDCLKQEALEVKFDKVSNCSLVESYKATINGFINNKWQEITINSTYKINKLKAVLDLEYEWNMNNINEYKNNKK